MPLEQYRRKRDFSRTPEPSGKAKGRRAEAASLRYLVQKHDATRLHYDFRLQVGDVLASWAVPKGPSLDPAHKRLAVRVEDHPLEYGDFEGIIPQGQYGGGTVMLWDTGTWTPHDKDPARAIRRGKLSFDLHGEKLSGAWTLTRIRSSKDSDADQDNWLLIKHEDDASSQGALDILDTPSVKSGRTLEQIAEDEGDTWQSKRAKRPGARRSSGRAGSKKSPRKAAFAPQDLTRAKKAAFPRSLTPQLCTLTDRAPAGDEWIHEIKFDGYRLLARRSASSVRLITRSGKDWTDRFKPIADAIADLPVESAILDGEACILDDSGHSSFQLLQNAVKARKFSALVYFAFDLLYLNGYDLRAAPLTERKALLRSLIPAARTARIRYSEHVVGSGAAVHTNACELALEGIISKRADAPYVQARSKSWLKVKCSRRQEFVVIGWSPPEGARKHFGSLLLAAHDADGRLTYTGRVGTGFTAASLKTIKSRLDALERKTCPAHVKPDRAESRGVRWVRPELVAEVEFTQWTDDGRLRHPSFQGLREDKPAAAVTVERAEPVEAIADEPTTSPKRPARAKRRAAAAPGVAGAAVAGVELTNPDRILYAESGVTKLDLARYYEFVAERILPFISNRPLSTVRCPQGRSGQCFFQKHIRETFTEHIIPLKVKEQSGYADYISINSLAGLITLVQFGVLEIHPWGSTADDLDHPDTLVFDLDPGDGVTFADLKRAADDIRTILTGVGLVPFLKTTGGKGLHIAVPIEQDTPWDDAKAFCHELARGMTRTDPNRYIDTLSKARRKGRIFIDYLRNARGATSVAPYSTRARPNATISTPIHWDELSSLDAPNTHTVANITRRLAHQKADPWRDFRSSRRSLTKALASLHP